MWPTSGRIGYITPTVWVVPNASKCGGENQKWPTSGWIGYITLAIGGGGGGHFRVGERISSGPQVGRIGYKALPSQGSPMLQSGG